MLAVVAACAGSFQLIPKATVSTYSLLAMSVELEGVVEIVPVVVAILVKTPVLGVVAPIVVHWAEEHGDYINCGKKSLYI